MIFLFFFGSQFEGFGHLLFCNQQVLNCLKPSVVQQMSNSKIPKVHVSAFTRNKHMTKKQVGSDASKQYLPLFFNISTNIFPDINTIFRFVYISSWWKKTRGLSDSCRRALALQARIFFYTEMAYVCRGFKVQLYASSCIFVWSHQGSNWLQKYIKDIY